MKDMKRLINRKMKYDCKAREMNECTRSAGFVKIFRAGDTQCMRNAKNEIT